MNAKAEGIHIRPFQETDRAAAVRVWLESGLCHPANDPHKDIDRKLGHSPEGFLVAEAEGLVVGTVMAGYDGHRGWINYLGVLPEWQQRGIGGALLERAEALLRAMDCPKINLQVRSTNLEVIAFYEARGYLQEDRANLGRRLVQDE
jgi:ribosomal protein S18 acetylase RimI-like enzyme